MSAELQVPRQEQGEPDLLDRIANALPEELRADYYREMTHCRMLPESDEMLRILRAMQFLTVLIEQVPARVAVEREQLAAVLTHAIDSMQATHEASIAYQKQLEARLAKLPEEIAKGISPEAISAKLTESLRQQFHQTGLPTVAEAIGVQAAQLRKAGKELSAAVDEFSHPGYGAVPQVHSALASMKADIANSADHIRAQMNGLGKELWRTIAVLFAVAVALGFIVGILYYRWIDTPVPVAAQQPPIPAVQGSAEPSARTGKPKIRKAN